MTPIELKKGDKFKILGNNRIPPASLPVEIGDILEYRYTDGMYSKCYNDKKETVYLVAYADIVRYFP